MSGKPKKQRLQPYIVDNSDEDWRVLQYLHEWCDMAEAIPDGIPFAVPWDELAKQHAKIPAKVRKIRGKLNVSRERFHRRGKDQSSARRILPPE